MHIPTIIELKRDFSLFCERERIGAAILLRPLSVVDILARYRFLHFLVIGGGGAVLGLGLIWFLTTFVFGLEGYFTAYLIGTGVSLAFNFTMYSLVIFKTSHQHARRLIVYFLYIIFIIAIQAAVVRTITPLVGLEWYLVVIASVVGLFSVINFLVFKLSIFKERDLALTEPS